VVRLDLVFTWGEANTIKGPFFKVLEAGYVVPSLKISSFRTAVVTSSWLPVVTVHSTFVLVATAGLW
jgi:hypothetical protein